jgi:hypothetical protein
MGPPEIDLPKIELAEINGATRAAIGEKTSPRKHASAPAIKLEEDVNLRRGIFAERQSPAKLREPEYSIDYSA